jgi:hypothetical protein
MSKSPKHFKFFSNGVLYQVCTYTVTITLHESGTRKAISWTVTVYNKKISCQCNLLAQLEPVQDKNISEIYSS